MTNLPSPGLVISNGLVEDSMQPCVNAIAADVGEGVSHKALSFSIDFTLSIAEKKKEEDLRQKQ